VFSEPCSNTVGGYRYPLRSPSPDPEQYSVDGPQQRGLLTTAKERDAGPARDHPRRMGCIRNLRRNSKSDAAFRPTDRDQRVDQQNPGRLIPPPSKMVHRSTGTPLFDGEREGSAVVLRAHKSECDSCRGAVAAPQARHRSGAPRRRAR